MDSVREGEDGKIWENGIETYKISCMEQVANLGSMHDTACLGLVHWEDPEIKFSTSVGSSKKQESPRKTHVFLLY